MFVPEPVGNDDYVSPNDLVVPARLSGCAGSAHDRLEKQPSRSAEKAPVTIGLKRFSRCTSWISSCFRAAVLSLSCTRLTSVHREGARPPPPLCPPVRHRFRPCLNGLRPRRRGLPRARLWLPELARPARHARDRVRRIAHGDGARAVLAEMPGHPGRGTREADRRYGLTMPAADSCRHAGHTLFVFLFAQRIAAARTLSRSASSSAGVVNVRSV